MHRHGAIINKLGRERDQRRALMKGLAVSLIEHESIETTVPKAKALRPFIEKLITKAKKGDLHNRRQIIAALGNYKAAHKLMDEIAPKVSHRSSGHVRIVKSENRRGDNAAMARISFVDDLTKSVNATPVTAKKEAK